MPRVSQYPPVSLSDALMLAQTIWEHNAGNEMRRLTIFDYLQRSPESSTSRGLITASSAYGLTQGGYAAETIKLTERGRAIVERNDAQAKLDAILGISLFAAFFDRYRSTIPSSQAAIDWLKSRGIPEKAAPACFEVILSNGEFVGLIQVTSGSKRIVSTEHALEWLNRQVVNAAAAPSAVSSSAKDQPQPSPTPLVTSNVPVQLRAQVPSVHIDIQIHIAADAQPDQIEQVFASMAKHLYSKE